MKKVREFVKRNPKLVTAIGAAIAAAAAAYGIPDGTTKSVIQVILSLLIGV